MASESKFKYDVYISHADEKDETESNNAFIRYLKTELEIRNVRLFEGMPGTFRTDSIQTGIKNSQHIVLILTKAWLNSGLTKLEQILGITEKIKIEFARIIPIELEPRLKLPPTIEGLISIPFSDISKKALDSSGQSRWERVIQHLLEAINIKEEEKNGMSFGRIIPSIKISGASTTFAREYLWDLTFNGTFGKLFKDNVQNDDELEVFVINHLDDRNFTAYLRLPKNNMSVLYKLGWRSRFEIDQFEAFIPRGYSGTILSNLKSTHDPDIKEIEFTSSDYQPVVTLRQFLVDALSGDVDPTLEETLEGIVKNIFDELSNLNDFANAIKKERQINFFQLYTSSIPNYILNISDLDAEKGIIRVKEQFPFQLRGETEYYRGIAGSPHTQKSNSPKMVTKGKKKIPLESFRKISNISIDRYDSNFFFVTQGGVKEESSGIIKYYLIPQDEPSLINLIDLVQTNKPVTIVASQEEETETPEHRNARIGNRFWNAFNDSEDDDLKKLPKRYVNELTRHFGQIREQPTLKGISVGNLILDHIIVSNSGKENSRKKTSIPPRLSLIDYGTLNGDRPLLKDGACLEASLWLTVIFAQFEELSEIANYFVKLNYTTSLKRFNERFFEDRGKQAIAGMIMYIRKRMWQLYHDNNLDQFWFAQYIELLYHEFLLHSQKQNHLLIISENEQIQRSIKSCLVLNLLLSLLDHNNYSSESEIF